MNFETTALGSLNPFKNGLKRKSHDSNSSEDDYSSNRKHRRRSSDRYDTKRSVERSRNSKRRNRSSSRQSKRRSRNRSSGYNRRASTNDRNVNNNINKPDQNGVSPIFFNKPIVSPVQSKTCSTPNETSKTLNQVRRDSDDSLDDYVMI